MAVARCVDVPRRSRASAIGASTGVLEPIRTAWHCADCPGGATSAANGSHSAAVRQLRGRYRGWPVSSTGPVAILPRDQGRPLSSVHHRRPRLCAASKRACERLPRQHETAAACGVSATNRQGGRVGLVYIDHAPPVWGCPGPAARPTSACSAEQRARPATAATTAIVFFGETAATGGAMSGTGPGRRAGETNSRSPEPVETNHNVSGRVCGPQRR